MWMRPRVTRHPVIGRPPAATRVLGTHRRLRGGADRHCGFLDGVRRKVCNFVDWRFDKWQAQNICKSGSSTRRLESKGIVNRDLSFSPPMCAGYNRHSCSPIRIWSTPLDSDGHVPNHCGLRNRLLEMMIATGALFSVSVSIRITKLRSQRFRSFIHIFKTNCMVYRLLDLLVKLSAVTDLEKKTILLIVVQYLQISEQNWVVLIKSTTSWGTHIMFPSMGDIR